MLRRMACAVLALLAACSPAPHAHHVAAAHLANTDSNAELVARPSAPSASVEADVLAAYYRARDVDSRAYFDLNPSQLATAYARDALDGRLDEIDRRVREGHPMQTRMEFHPHVTMLGPTMAIVDDDVKNHSVRLDPVTKQPVEADPNELLQDTFTLERLEGRWLVVLTARVAS